MVADHFVDDKAQEFFAEFGVQIGRLGQGPKPSDLALFAVGISRRHGDLRLVFSYRLRNPETLSQHVDEGGINVVDALSITGQHRVSDGHIRALRIGGSLRFMRHSCPN